MAADRATQQVSVEDSPVHMSQPTVSMAADYLDHGVKQRLVQGFFRELAESSGRDTIEPKLWSNIAEFCRYTPYFAITGADIRPSENGQCIQLSPAACKRIGDEDEEDEDDDEYGDEYDDEYGDEYNDEYGDEYDDEDECEDEDEFVPTCNVSFGDFIIDPRKHRGRIILHIRSSYMPNSIYFGLGAHKRTAVGSLNGMGSDGMAEAFENFKKFSFALPHDESDKLIEDELFLVEFNSVKGSLILFDKNDNELDKMHIQIRPDTVYTFAASMVHPSDRVRMIKLEHRCCAVFERIQQRIIQILQQSGYGKTHPDYQRILRAQTELAVDDLRKKMYKQ